MKTPRVRLRASVGLGAACLALMAFSASAGAATTVFPAGGSGFNTGPEGWTPGVSSCAPIGLLCTAEAAYEPGVGNPPGSIAAKTTLTLNAIDLFKGTESWTSPQFTVPAGEVTGASVRLDRAFDPGGLIEVGPKANYTVTLKDLTTGSASTPLSEELTTADTAFVNRSGAATVVGGHSYQLSIEATTAQSVLAVSLLTGTTAVRFDNVGLLVQTAAGGGGTGGGPGGGGGGTGGGSGGSNSGSSLTDSQLHSLIQSSLSGTATFKGKHVFVRVKCPAKVTRFCKISVQGFLKKGQAATSMRTARVGKGKTKRFVLQVRPKARAQVAMRKRLLFKETVRAGKAKASVYKSLELVRR
jgi:hypothetical protein